MEPRSCLVGGGGWVREAAVNLDITSVSLHIQEKKINLHPLLQKLIN